MVEVTQADREAYLEWNAGGRLPCGQDERDAVLSGDLDDNRLLQAFAAHREAGHRAGLEEAAGIAEGHRYGDSFLDSCGLRKEHREDIAAAIARSLGHE